VRIRALVGVAAALATFGAGGAALAASTPPHIKGSTYCETVTKPNDYTLYGYVKGVGCATEKAWVTRCESKTGLQGWSFTSSPNYGFLLRKGGATMDLQIAGGSPPCILKAQGD
jgi:hypothetical protein